MVAALAARWLLTALFAAAGLGALPARRRAGTARPKDRVSNAYHVLMCATLIAMTWVSEPAPGPVVAAALFGCAVIWFRLASPGQKARFWPVSLPGAHHALMVGAMIWMITAMPADISMAPAGAASAAMAPMSHPAMPATVLAVSVLLAACFALAAIAWLVRAIRPGRRMNSKAAASHAAISAGMTAMLLAML